MKKIVGVHYVYWIFWILVYLSITMNGHIHRFVESGTITRENGLNFVAGWEYIYLPVLMAVLLGWIAHISYAKRFIIPMIVLGLLFSSYIHYDLLGIGHTIYVLILGILSFGVIRYIKQKSKGTDEALAIE